MNEFIKMKEEYRMAIKEAKSKLCDEKDFVKKQQYDRTTWAIINQSKRSST